MKKQKHFLIAILLIAALGASSQQPGSIDHSFNPNDVGYGLYDGTDNVVTTMVKQPDGKILISGLFTTCHGVSRNRIARLNPDGSLDESFNPGTGANQQVRSMALLPNGKILIGGNFTQFNGAPVNRFARLNADGSLDENFTTGTGPNLGTIRSISLFANGKILIAGDFTQFNGVAINRIARLNADGSLDTSFDPGTGANSMIWHTSILPDGKIMIGGWFTQFNNTPRNYIARLLSNGSLDFGFDPGEGPNSFVYNIARQNDGKLIIAGEFTEISTISCNRLARLNTDGSLDTSFDPGTGANWWTMGIFIQEDEKIIISGGFTQFNNLPLRLVVRLNNDGSLDPTFSSQASSGAIYVINPLSDNKFIMVGQFSEYGGQARKSLAGIFDDGSLDNSMFSNLGTGANDLIYDLKTNPNGKIFIGGNFTAYNGVSLNRFARLNQDGEVDNTFDIGAGPNSQVRKILLQPDGKIIISGFFSSYNAIEISRIARINPDGSLDAGFNPGAGPNDLISAMGLLPDGKIMIVGSFTEFDNVSRNRIARLNADGSLDTGFDPGTGANNTITSIQVQSDNKIYIGGAFTTFNDTEVNFLARLNYDGSIDDSFNLGSGTNSEVASIALLPDGKIIIGGGFTMFNGQSINHVARIFNDGSLDLDFNPGSGSNGGVGIVRPEANGKILISGNFTMFDGFNVNRIARLNSDGSLDNSFDSGEGPNNSIQAMELQADDKILIGGWFTAYDNTGRNCLARLHSGPATFIKEIPKDCTIRIFPNPASAMFTIDLGKEYSKVLVEITDLSGRLIQSIHSDKMRFVYSDLTGYPSGIYLVRIYADDIHRTLKVSRE